MTTTVSLRMMEPVRVRTFDAARRDDDDGAEDLRLSDLANTLSPADLAEVRRIVGKYTTSGMTTNAMGAAVNDAGALGRAAAAKVRGQIEVTQALNARNRDFWDARNRELRASITR